MKIFVAGHNGMVGRAVSNKINQSDKYQLITCSRSELDLSNQSDVMDFYNDKKPDIVIDAAAKVGGILANNSFPYEFIMENLKIQNNLIDGALNNDIDKFVFLGSSCIYPKFAAQPLKEEYLLTNSLEPTNEWYAIAKIAGVKACEAASKQYNKNYLSLMPTNLYGENDNFDLNSSHVLPAMIRKFHEAKLNNHSEVELWGDGSPFREFMHVNDLAEAVFFAIENNLSDTLYNVGTGTDISIKNLALLIQKTIGHTGKIKWNDQMPNGTPKKLMDVSRLNEKGWKAHIKLEDGIRSTYDWFLSNQESLRKVIMK